MKVQGEKAAFTLPLPPLTLGPTLKVLHLGEGDTCTLPYIRVMGQKSAWRKSGQGGVKKPSEKWEEKKWQKFESSSRMNGIRGKRKAYEGEG